MNLQFIKYFLTLAETKNFTRASEKMFVVQSTFSMGIKKLEESLNTPLFYRDKRNVSLTASGEALLPKAKELLKLWSTIEEDFSGVNYKALEIGFIQNLSIDAVLPFVNNFKSLWPSVELNISEDKHNVMLNMLKNRKISAFFTENQDIDTSKFNISVVASEKLFLAVHKQHPLAKMNKVSLNSLHKQRFIERSHCALYEEVFASLKAKQIQPKKVFTAHNNETVAALISSGMGITLMPKPIFPVPDIVFIELNDEQFMRDIILIWNKEDSDKSLNNFLNSAGIKS